MSSVVQKAHTNPIDSYVPSPAHLNQLDVATALNSIASSKASQSFALFVLRVVRRVDRRDDNGRGDMAMYPFYLGIATPKQAAAVAAAVGRAEE